MQRTQFADLACSIARTLDVVGEPWSPLILRDVWVGIRRFDAIQADLGISRKVLTERLNWLLDCGVLERQGVARIAIGVAQPSTEHTGDVAQQGGCAEGPRLGEGGKALC